MKRTDINIHLKIVKSGFEIVKGCNKIEMLFRIMYNYNNTPGNSINSKIIP